MTAMTEKTMTVETLQQLAGSPADVLARVSEVVVSLASEDEEVRAWASDVLGQLESVSSEAAVSVAPHCQHASPAVASWACKLLSKAKPFDPAWEALICHTLENHASVAARAEAAGSLSKLESLSAETKQALIKAASGDDPRLSRLASRALER